MCKFKLGVDEQDTLDLLAMMSCDQLDEQREYVLHLTRLINNERRKRRGYGTEDCHCEEKQKK